MLVLICFLVAIIGNLNWLCIGFFQYDFIAGLFGTQSSIFSRLIYIIFGISSIFLLYAVIRYKGRLTLKKNKNQDQVLLNKQPLPNSIDQNQNIVNYSGQNSNLNTSINQTQNSTDNNNVNVNNGN